MANNWKETTLGEVAEVIDCPHSTPKWTTEGYFVVRNYNLSNGWITKEKPSYTDKKNYHERIRRAKLERGDIILSREAPIGSLGRVNGNENICLGQRVVLLKPQHCDSKFLLYEMLSPIIQNEFKIARDTGSVVSNFRIPQIKSLVVFLPPLPEQKAIAAILSSLDDKIDLLRRQNKTLEKIAQTIFKEWFVNFTVKGKKLKTGNSTDLPEGWRLGTLEEIVKIHGGGTPKTHRDEYWNGHIPWFSVADVPFEGNVFVIKCEKHISKKGLENSSTEILPVNTTIITARGTVGKLALTGVLMAMNQSCYGITPKDGKSFFYLYLLMKKSIAALKSQVHGAVFDTITRDTLNGLPSVAPADRILEAFKTAAKPFFEKILLNNQQIQTLSKLRDSLLPKLMNGEIRVKDMNSLVSNIL